MSGVRLVVNLHSKPGHAADYIAACQARGEEVRREPGCLQYELCHSSVHPDNVVLLEWWDSRANFDDHWELERSRTPVGIEFLGKWNDREIGEDGLEIYWEQTAYRFDTATETWTPR